MTAAKQALADKLARLSDKLHAASGEIEALGWPRHALQLSWMTSMTSIYSHQLRASATLTVDQALAALDSEMGGGA